MAVRVISDWAKVGEFHAKFGLPVGWEQKPRFLDLGEHVYRQNFMAEELREYREAHQQRDLVRVADALVDLAYVVLGTAHYHGLPWVPLFEVVHRANLAKERGDGHDRGPCERVIKPPGWQPPAIAEILKSAGWRPE